MFTIEFAQDFSGLSDYQVSKLQNDGIIEPIYENGSRYFSYADIYIMRIFKLFISKGLRFQNIKFAYQYLKEYKPDQSLTSFNLLHDGKKIYECSSDIKVIASDWGQTYLDQIMNNSLSIMAVGEILESTRHSMNRFVSQIKRRQAGAQKKPPKSYSYEEMLRKFA